MDLQTVHNIAEMAEYPGTRRPPLFPSIAEISTSLAAAQNNQFPGVPSRKRKLNSPDDNFGEDSLSQLEASKTEFASGLIIKYIRHLTNDNLPGRSDMQAQDLCHRDLLAWLHLSILSLLFTSLKLPTHRVLDLMETCHKEKNYCPLIRYELSRGNSFVDDLYDQERTITDAQNSTELSAKVESVISTFSPVLRDYARGALDYQFSPKHEGQSPHADVHNSSAERVHLLLSGLGDPDREALTDWRRIYQSDRPNCSFFTTYVIDLPGYGKTRLQFEGILDFFVIYFSCSKEELTWATGSGDVAWALRSLSETRNLDLDASQKNGIEKRTLYMVLYSRLVVLRRFLRYMLDFNVTPHDARRRLLLIQACPPCLSDNTDIFLEVTKISHLCSTEVLAKQTELALQDCNRSVTQLLRQNSSSDCPMFHVLIDEVQVVAQKYETLSDWWNNPALAAFVGLIQEAIHPRGIIAGASGLPVQEYHMPLYSSGRRSEIRALLTTTRIWPDGSDTNEVHEEKMLRDWILAHFPELVDVPGLLSRIEKWLSSRPRLVARLLEMYMQAEELLADRTKIPYHKILSQAFCVSTGFQPMDGIIYESTEGEIPEAMTGCSFECGIMTVRKRFEQDGLEQDVRLLELSSRMLYRWILSSDALDLKCDTYSAVKLLDIGLMPLPSLAAQSSDSFRISLSASVAMSEPFSSLSYMALLSSMNKHIFKTSITGVMLDGPDRSSLFENLMVFILMENLGRPDGCCLSDVICFKNPAPIWAASRYRLVGLVKNESDDTFASVPVAWNSGASPRLGFKPTQPEDFHQWLIDPHGVPFIFPDAHHGAEGFAVMENVTTKERVFLAVQNKVGQSEPFLNATSIREKWQLECKPPADTHMLEIWPTVTSDINQAEKAIVEHEKVTEGLQRREDPRVIHVIATIHDDTGYQWALDRYDSSTLGVLRPNIVSVYDEHLLSRLRWIADL